MAEKLELLDRDYLSKMPKGTSRPRLTVQDEQAGACVELPYYTENPEPDELMNIGKVCLPVVALGKRTMQFRHIIIGFV